MSDSSAVPVSESEPLAYTVWAVFRREPGAAAPTGDLTDAVAAVESTGITVRGFYDVSGLRSDADLMVWLHARPDQADAPEALQAALRTLRRTSLLGALVPVWNAMGVHRPAEFTSGHLPAFVRGRDPETWLTVYPFVRSYEWYLLPEAERRQMLGDHGRKGAEYRQVLANTVASFALGDYEWILALEAPELVDLVDLMRHLRQTDARRHVREEVPFYTGRRIGVDEVVEVLS